MRTATSLAAIGSPSASAHTWRLSAGSAMSQEVANLTPTVDRSFDIGNWPAHVVRYDDGSGTEVVSLYYVFVQSLGLAASMNGVTSDNLRRAGEPVKFARPEP